MPPGRPRTVDPASVTMLSIRIPVELRAWLESRGHASTVARDILEAARKPTLEEVVIASIDAHLPDPQVEVETFHVEPSASESDHKECTHPSARRSGTFCFACHLDVGRGV